MEYQGSFIAVGLVIRLLERNSKLTSESFFESALMGMNELLFARVPFMTSAWTKLGFISLGSGLYRQNVTLRYNLPRPDAIGFVESHILRMISEGICR